MNKTFTKEALAAWVNVLKEMAKADEQFDKCWFTPTKDSKFGIIAKWEDGYDPGFADLFCQSRSNPTKALCVEVIEQTTKRFLTAVETEVEHACVVLEWEDDPDQVAEFFMIEWEQLMDAYEKG